MRKPFKSNKRKPEFGNYKGYYGYRNPERSDPRLEVLSSDYFERKVVLDIGCNNGLFTLEIAKRYNPAVITGLDIDGELIKMARKRLMSEANKCNIDPNQAANGFPNNVYFRQEDFMVSNCTSAQFDCILALSITKWIHLNHGDEGITNFFQKMSNLCKMNGCLILEFQPWKSYKRKKLLSDTLKMMFESIKLRPDKFANILVHQFGFVLEADHKPRNTQKGFDRSILIFRKRNGKDPEETHIANK